MAIPAVAAEWQRALTAPPWEGPPVWHHGDLDARNWLVRDGRIRAVIDWGSMGVGDPACDVMVAWKLHSREARDAFREALPTDDATWERARGWAVSQAVAALSYYTPENNPTLVQRGGELARACPFRQRLARQSRLRSSTRRRLRPPSSSVPLEKRREETLQRHQGKPLLVARGAARGRRRRARARPD